MASYSTPSGDIFAVDDAELHGQILTLAALVVEGDKSGALSALAKAYESTTSIDYVTLVVQEALTRVAIYLVTEATPADTIPINKTFSAVTYAIRSLDAAARSPKP